MILYFFLFYFLIGVAEYFRLSEEFKKQMQEDFPYHEEWYLELCILVVSICFGPVLLLMKIFLMVRNFFIRLWKKILFPYRMYKFKKKLEKLQDEPDDMKKAKMLFDAMREVIE